MSFRSERRDPQKRGRWREETPRRRGTPAVRGVRYTFISFFIIMASLFGMKAMRPDIQIKGTVTMVAAVAIGCAIMAVIGRRGGR